MAGDGWKASLFDLLDNNAKDVNRKLLKLKRMKNGDGQYE